MLYERIFKELNNSGIKYVVIGGIAVNLYGYSRATGDLDMIISLTDAELEKFIQVVKKLNLVSRLPVKLDDLANASKRDEWMHEKNMKVFSVYNPEDPIEHIDLMIHGSEKFDKIISNRVIMKTDLITIPVPSFDDLIELKREAGRDRDLLDIKMLKKIKDI